MVQNRIIVGAALALWAIAGCNTDIAKTSQNEPLQSRATGEVRWLQRSVAVDLRSGYSSVDLQPNSEWRAVGSIPQGEVLKPISTVLTVNAGDKYEAYLVVNQNQLVGIYLPVESAFVNATQPVNIYLAETKP